MTESVPISRIQPTNDDHGNHQSSNVRFACSAERYSWINLSVQFLHNEQAGALPEAENFFLEFPLVGEKASNLLVGSVIARSFHCLKENNFDVLLVFFLLLFSCFDIDIDLSNGDWIPVD